MCPVLPTVLYQSIVNDAAVAEKVRNAAADQLKQNEFFQQALKETPMAIAKAAPGNSQFTYSIYSLEGKYYWDSRDSQGTIKQGTNIANPNAVTNLPGTKLQDSTGFRTKRADGSVVEDPAQKMTYDGFKATYELYKTAFGRNSLDDKGLEMRASIHLARGLDNAFWSPAHSQMIFGDGGRWDGRGWLMEETGNRDDPLDDFSLSRLRDVASLSNWLDNYDLDTIGHELTHGVVEFTAGLGNAQWNKRDWPAYSEAGTLNEHIADCFGVMVKHFVNQHTAEKANWHFSPGQFSRLCCKANGWTSDYCRTFTVPEDPKKSPDPYPKHWKDKWDWKDGTFGLDPHVNCGIASHAFYLAALAFKGVNGGFTWQTVGKIWYAALTDNEFTKPENQTFSGWRNLTVKHADKQFGADGKSKLERAWQAVGL